MMETVTVLTVRQMTIARSKAEMFLAEPRKNVLPSYSDW
jgi:hypothetical protein